MIYENLEAIEARRRYASELNATVNSLLISYKDKFNYFGQKIDESFAIQLLTDPLGTFDELLRVNSPIKPIAGKPIDITLLAQLTGIDREGFIAAYAVIMPGSRDRYNKTGTRAIFKLAEADKAILIWNDGEFSIDDKALSMQLENYRSYCTTPEQAAEVDHWDNLCKTLNNHLIRPAMRDHKLYPGERRFLDAADLYQIAEKLGLKLINNRFDFDHKIVADIIKKMQLVN